MQRTELTDYLSDLLQVPSFADYCPNGLQVEGRSEIRRLVAGVTACQILLEEAIAYDADAILVHHGYFWKGENAKIAGIKKQRLATLLRADVNLYAYHLPLDAHPELGNNAQLAKIMGWQAEGRFGEQELGWLGSLPNAMSAGSLEVELSCKLERKSLLIGERERKLKKLAWCTGGAQGWFEAAIDAGVDAFISGEISEPVVHLARESGVSYIAAGHHATERYGVKALASHLAQHCDIEANFVDVDNPI